MSTTFVEATSSTRDRDEVPGVLSDLLGSAYDERAFQRFVAEVAGREALSSRVRTYPPKGAFEVFGEHFNEIRRLGAISNGRSAPQIDVIAVEMSSASKLERARTAQRDLAERYVRYRDEREGQCDGVVAAYYAEDGSSWRLSLVEVSIEVERDEETGEVEMHRRVTPARRHSFLIGSSESTHTATKQLLPLLNGRQPSLPNLIVAFEVDSVTEEFFDSYKEHYRSLRDEVVELRREKESFDRELSAAGVTEEAFAKKILSQIVFLYFLQKKGWLGVGRSKTGQFKNWGEGPKNFLRLLYEEKYVEYDNFFEECLEPLFYQALATERRRSYFRPLDCCIPFLNGGLFEPTGGYVWEEAASPLPNSLFGNILDTFDRYNFTVREDEPLDREVAVDPEMLGHVFEKLLGAEKQKEKGAFYTPREVVQYMSEEALSDYLEEALTDHSVIPLRQDAQTNAFEAPAGSQPSLEVKEETVPLSRSDIQALVRSEESGGGTDESSLLSEEKKKGAVSLPAAVREHADEIDALLKRIKVCDPAIGSGAFPVGIMKAIVRARQVLSPYLSSTRGKSLDDDGTGSQTRSPYRLKREAIENSLYGVDLDGSAVEIARLRLWLSLVVDEEDFSEIEPLPNLRYRIVQGDALELVERNLMNNEKEAQLHRKIQDHISASHPLEKESLQSEIDELIEDLTGEGDTFDFRIFFGHVFTEQGGFDVVIGNPPYVRQERLTAAQKRDYENRYEVYYGSADLYAYFIERGMGLLKEGGAFCYITSNKWMRARYGGPLRSWLKSQRIVELVNFGDLPVFQGTVAYPCILRMKKRPAADAFFGTDVEGLSYNSLTNYVSENRFEVLRRSLRPKGWALVDRDTQKLLDKLAATGTALGNYLQQRKTDLYRGIVTGRNPAFVVDEAKRAELIRKDESSSDIIVPVLRGSDVDRYEPPEARNYLLFTRRGVDIEDYPAVKEHLMQYKDRLEPKPSGWDGEGKWKGRKAGPYEWYEIQDTIDYHLKFERPKILFPDLSKEGGFTYDEQGNYALNTAYMIPDADKYLLALLNSSLMAFYYTNAFSVYRGGYLRFFTQYLEQLPIAETKDSERKELRLLAKRQLQLHEREPENDVDRKAWKQQIESNDRQIDRAVYSLYGLTQEEIETVEDVMG